ncbi:GDP-mannose 4,6-dehydratase [Sediminitomix flava]|uniref:Nucleoside-diphosphate-sugar epimerase n=1 Tax=Sediminitomix flava TaxID=379075 RepID=A0A315ZAU3_SEDFL|nr:GDP-mannose 4,6-dehydratase [Sediminitomix flava]PWJ42269.1 nucleoside-diphosphate-sugar epimerase [Sediminitomix flava]
MRTRVLITGVAGFIGSSLAEFLLEDGFEVVGIDNFDPFYDKSIKLRNLHESLKNSRFTFKEVDFTSLKSLMTIPKVDVVIHLGAKAGVRPSILNPKAYIDTNVQGTNNILEWMRLKKIKKLVFASSSSVYGNHKQVPFSEDLVVTEPISPYAFTKLSCESMNYSYHSLYNFDILNLRFFTVYGPRQRPDLAIHKFVRKIYRGESIQMYGDGSSARDYTFIDDIVNGVYGAVNYVLSNDQIFDILNLGNNTPVKLKEMIQTIECKMKVSAKIEQLPMQSGDVDVTFASIRKAKKMLGYVPQTSFDLGVEQFVDWFITLREESSMAV